MVEKARIDCPHCIGGQMVWNPYLSEWGCFNCGRSLPINPILNINGLRDNTLLLAESLRNSFKNHNRKRTTRYSDIQRRVIRRLKTSLVYKQVSEITGVSISTCYRIYKETND